ncbi:MAG TPA: class D sortase [Clostridia bacterium]|nr:class D sortase [Clostridia bacterium]
MRNADYNKINYNKIKRYLPTAFIVLGLVLLGYVATQYGQMYFEQRSLHRQWQAQQERSSQDPATEAAADDGLTRLSIPKINLLAVIVEGTSRKKLLLGPGHIENTAAPGELGNSVITAHRDTFFRHIYELTKGDDLLVQRNGKSYKYEVTGKKIVSPSDVSVIQPTTEGRLTLITCYPTYYIGPAPERLVIFSKLVEGDGEAQNKLTTTHLDATALPKDNSKSATGSR